MHHYNVFIYVCYGNGFVGIPNESVEVEEKNYVKSYSIQNKNFSLSTL